MNPAVRAYLAERDVIYAVFGSTGRAEIAAYRDFMGWTTPWYSTADSEDVLRPKRGDLRCYLRVGDEVFQTYETKWRGIEAMLPTLQLLGHSLRSTGRLGEDSPAGRSRTRLGRGGGVTADQLLSGRAPTHRSNRIAALTSSSFTLGMIHPKVHPMPRPKRRHVLPAVPGGLTRRCSRPLLGAIPAHCLMSLARSCGRLPKCPNLGKWPSPRAALLPIAFSLAPDRPGHTSL